MRFRLVFGFLAGLPLAADASDRAMTGSWARGDGAAHVRIAPCGTSVCAINTWIKNPAGGEKVGDRLVMSLTPNTAGVLRGTAHDPQRSLTFSIEVRVAGRSMTTRGCVLGGAICKNMAWARLR